MTEDLFRHLRTAVAALDEPVGEMNRLDERQQLLVILMEECGELIQECSKNLRRGEFFDREAFKNVISWDEIEERERVKRKKLSKWSDLIGQSETELYEREDK